MKCCIEVEDSYMQDLIARTNLSTEEILKYSLGSFKWLISSLEKDRLVLSLNADGSIGDLLCSDFIFKRGELA